MDAPWYRDGLQFTCTGCGRCCTGPPGYVWVGRRDIEALAARLSLSVEAFGRRYLRKVGPRHSLLERKNGECVFYRPGGGCSVYGARPRQCRVFPFWRENIESAEAWETLKSECEGARAGRLYPIQEIQLIQKGKGDALGH